MTLKHAQAELKTKQAEVKKMDSGYKKDQDALQAVKSNSGKLQAELAKLNYQGTVCVSCESIKTLYLLLLLLLLTLFCIDVWGLCLYVCRWEGGESVGQRKTAVQRSHFT